MAIYDGKVSQSGLKCLVSLGIAYLSLNNYSEFIITCPNCGERIDDEMILHTYDENVLSGYNILCIHDITRRKRCSKMYGYSYPCGMQQYR